MSAWARLSSAVRRRPFSSALAALAALLVLLVVGILALLYSEPGRAVLARYIEKALSTPGGVEVEIGRLHGPLPAGIWIDRITVSDSGGVWMTVRDFELEWRPLALFGARLQIDTARADKVAVLRRPMFPEKPAQLAEGPDGRMFPPLEIALESVTITTLQLDEPVLGEAAGLTVTASGAALRDRAIVRLNAERVDGMRGTAHAVLDWNASTGSLEIDAALSEPADGVMARLLDLPGRPPLDLSVTGDGPARDWRGHATLAAGALLSLDSSLSISIERDFRLTMKGDASPGEPLGLEVASLFGPQTAFDLELRRQAEGGDWAVTISELKSAAIAAGGEMRISAATTQIDGTLELETVDSGRLVRLAEPATFEAVVANVGFSGPLTHPILKLESVVDDLTMEGFAAARTNLRAELQPDRPLKSADVQISAQGEIRFSSLKAPSPELSALLGEAPHLTVTGARLSRFHQITIGRVVVLGAKANALLIGEMDLDSGVLNASGQASIDDLAPFSDAAGRPISGRTQTDFVLGRAADGAIDLALNGVLRDAGLEQPAAERLLGPEARFAGKIRRQPDGTFSLSNLALSGKGIEAKGVLSLRPETKTLEADYDIAISDLGALGIEDPAMVDGSLGIAGKATGPVGNPAISGELRLAAAAPAGFRVKQLAAQYSVTGLATAPQGDFRFKGETDLLPDLVGRAGFTIAENRLALRGISLSARDTSVEGALAIPLDDLTATGNLYVRSGDIASWSAVAGRPMTGSFEARVNLLGERNRQDAQLDATFSSVAIGENISSRHIRLEMQASDLVSLRRLRGLVVVRDAQTGPASIGEAIFKLEGPVQDLAFSIGASGNMREQDLRLDANGHLRKTDDRTTLTIASLSGSAAGVPLRLRQPAFVEIDPTIDTGDIDLTVGDGSASVRYRQGGGTVSMRAEIDALPLGSIWPPTPPQFRAAVIDANASLDGPVGAPAGRLDLLVAGVAAGETKELQEGLTLQLRGDLRGGKLAADGRIEGLSGVTSQTKVILPVQLSVTPAQFSIDERAPFGGSITYNGPVGPGWSVLGLDRHRLEGEGDVNIELSGSLGEPRISGRVAMAKGRYENLDTGTILSDIQLSVRPSNSALNIDKAFAKDGGDGEVSLSGRIGFGGEDLIAMDLQANLRQAHLIRRDDLSAVASGDLTLRGNTSKRTVSGKIVVDQADLRLVGGLPPGVVAIPVEEIGTPPTGAPSAPAPPKPSRTDLDLKVSMPKRVFVRGRGLDSEWGGELKVSGTSASPRVQGELRPLRGRYDFAGKIFRLREGSIAFAGDDEIDPALDLSAEREATDLMAIIRIAGTARKPVVTLESVPEYPQDEVLARVFFNKSTGRLSPSEALQLAQAIGALTGATDGGGIMDFARGMLNLDVLHFRGGGEEGEAGAEAGKYLSDRVYLGVEGDATGETGVTVEIEITPRVKLESDVGPKNKGQTGLKWKRDY